MLLTLVRNYFIFFFVLARVVSQLRSELNREFFASGFMFLAEQLVWEIYFLVFIWETTWPSLSQPIKQVRDGLAKLLAELSPILNENRIGPPILILPPESQRVLNCETQQMMLHLEVYSGRLDLAFFVDKTAVSILKQTTLVSQFLWKLSHYITTVVREFEGWWLWAGPNTKLFLRIECPCKSISATTYPSSCS